MPTLSRLDLIWILFTFQLKQKEKKIPSQNNFYIWINCIYNRRFVESNRQENIYPVACLNCVFFFFLFFSLSRNRLRAFHLFSIVSFFSSFRFRLIFQIPSLYLILTATVIFDSRQNGIFSIIWYFLVSFLFFFNWKSPSIILKAQKKMSRI